MLNVYQNNSQLVSFISILKMSVSIEQRGTQGVTSCHSQSHDHKMSLETNNLKLCTVQWIPICTTSSHKNLSLHKSQNTGHKIIKRKIRKELHK